MGYSFDHLRESLTVSEGVRRSMYGNRAVETEPEKRVRKALWAADLRGFRKNVKKLPGKPDVVFGRGRVAIFVHGCFWHSCPACQGERVPKTNARYWSAKLQGNRERDVRNRAALEALGYKVLVLWECEVSPKNVDEAIDRVREVLAVARAN